MEIGLSAIDGAALHGLLADAGGDIVIKLDPQGFIEHASPNIAALGFNLSELLFLPHISDLACPKHSGALRVFVANALQSDEPCDWFEFPIANRGEAGPLDGRQWHALSLRNVPSAEGSSGGALALLRSVEQRRVLENELQASTNTDALTGLGNRKVFCAKLSRQLNVRGDGVLALFEIERFRAIFLQYGQRAADEVLWAFAQFLQAMAQHSHDLAHLDGGRFGVILPNMSAEAARTWCEDVLETFAALAIGATPREPRLSASVGLTSLDGSLDATFKQAELALVMARASGGMRVGISGDRRGPIVFRERPLVSELGASFAAS